MSYNPSFKHSNEKSEKLIGEALNFRSDFESVSDIFKLLSDTNRIMIFWMLCHTEECVINLSVMLGISSPALSHHLKQLKDNGIIVSRRNGKEVYYKAADTEQVRALHRAVEQMIMISCPKRQREVCRNSETDIPLSEQEQTVMAIHDYLSSHLEERLTINELSHKFLMNPTTIKEKFKKMYGTSVAAHIKEHRMEKAAGLLTETDIPVSEIALKTGYTSQSKFSQSFSAFFGMPPLEYRKANKNIF